MWNKLIMKFFYINILLFFLLNNVFAQNYKIQASVSKNKIAIDERFEYKVEVNGQSTSLPDPVLPEFTDFAVLSGPNSSTNIQYINGKMSAAKSYSYILMPRELGKFTLPPSTVEVDGETLESNRINIEVVQQSKKQPQQTQKSPESSTDEDLLGENLYLKTIVNNHNVFQNEMVLVTYKLYFRLTVRSYNFEKIPANPGFWNEEFKLPGQPSISTEIVNGIAYQVATLRQIALFPTQSGELTIEPLLVSVDAQVQRQSRSRNLFDSFFDDPFGRTVRKTLSSQPVKISVKELPENGKPADFNGVVGKYSMSLNADKNEIKANDALSIKLTIAGEGNIKLIVPPKLNTPPDIEVYDPKEKLNILRENGTIKGHKEVEYILVPRYEGNYTIKPVTFSYFDSKARKYKTLSSQPINLTVIAGDIGAPGIISGGALSKQEVELLGKDIRYIKEVASFSKNGEMLYQNIYYLLSYLAPLLLIALAWYYRKEQDKLIGDVQFARRKKAGKIAAKYLSQAKKSMRGDSGKEFYRLMSKALQGFVSDKLNIDMTDFTAESVHTNLKKRNVKVEEIKEYQECLEESDFRQFAGGNVDLNEMKSFYDKAGKCLTNLEKYI